MSSRIVTRSVYGSSLQTKMLMDLPYVMVPNTTLNERFGIQADIPPQEGQMPHLKYFCIGNGGHRNRTGADGVPYTTPINHKASDAALFNPLPFVLRAVNDDLSPARRQQYALRREEEHGGQRYYAYYLKRLDLSAVNAVMHITTVQDGVETTLPFQPTNSNLYPEPPETPPEGVLPTNGNYLTTSAIMEVLFNAQDVEELIAVAEILYDNQYMAVVSEIGLCSGVDRQITAPGPGNTNFEFNEAIAVQICSFITAYYSMAYANEGFDFHVELGATEPLLGEEEG